MRTVPQRSIIDTNVLLIANNTDAAISQAYPQLVIDCIETLLSISQKNKVVVLDADGEIFNEYISIERSARVSLSGQPGVGDAFIKWLHDTRWSFPDTDRISLHRLERGYREFPNDLLDIVDPSDMKFIALSYAHPKKPPIFQATDSKWWRWKEQLAKHDISVIFLSVPYMTDHNTETA